MYFYKEKNLATQAAIMKPTACASQLFSEDEKLWQDRSSGSGPKNGDLEKCQISFQLKLAAAYQLCPNIVQSKVAKLINAMLCTKFGVQSMMTFLQLYL
jgi:hypothetical protein